MLKGRNIVVGVCGGIAAYKVVEVVSRLKKLGAEVNVLMTKNSAEFVSPLTFQSLSGNQVVSDMFGEPKTWEVEHISMARKADLMVIAPATANVIGKVAGGIADDMLTTTIMATRAPVLFVPAMNHVMYENPIVQDNIDKLKEYGYLFMEPDTGLMAAEGEYGKGRLPEPGSITRHIEYIMYPQKDLKGVKMLVTAGPTREAIDPVRYISNHSSGKMGYAVAEAAYLRGAEVKLITGPVEVKMPYDIETINVNSSLDMYDAVMQNYEDCGVAVLVAAVADYRCRNIADRKIKKTEKDMFIELEKNPDIAIELGKVKGGRIVVGTCAETDNMVENARDKLVRKNFDLIMANDVTMEGAGFGTDTNIVKLIGKDGFMRELPIMKKIEVAHEILDEVVKLIKKH